MRTPRGKLVAWYSVTLAVVVLAACGFVFRDAFVEEWYIRRLRSGDEKEVEAAAEKLVEVGSVRAVPYLLEAFADHSSGSSTRKAVFCETALLRISEATGRATVPNLSRGLEHESKWVRLVSAECLGALGPQAKTALPALRKAQWDRDQHVGLIALWALNNVREGKAIHLQILYGRFYANDPTRRSP